MQETGKGVSAIQKNGKGSKDTGETEGRTPFPTFPHGGRRKKKYRLMVFNKRITEGKQNLGASYNIKFKALELRKKATPQERILWEKLRRKQLNGMYFRRQHPYNIYILDFFCFEANLAIEIDGEIHQTRLEYDAERTRFLESSGLKVLRFTNNDIDHRLNWVIEEINNHLLNK